MNGTSQKPAVQQDTDQHQTNTDQHQTNRVDGGEQNEVIKTTINHTNLTVGDLEEAVQGVATGAADSEHAEFFGELMQNTPLPTGHSDYLLGQCDEVIRRSQDALAFASNRGLDTTRYTAQVTAAQHGKQQINADKTKFVQINGKLPVVLSALRLFKKRTDYADSMIEGLVVEVGMDTVHAWLQDPLPEEVREQIGYSTPGAGALSGDGLQGELGLTNPDTQDPLTLAAKDINGLRVEILGTVEQLDAAASLQVAAMREVDANTYEAEISRINGIKSSYGTLVSLCKGAVDLASGNWFGPLADAMNGIVGLVADHQSAIAAARQKASRMDAVFARMNAGATLASSAQTSLTGQHDQLTAAIGAYGTAERDIRRARDARRGALLQVGAHASGENDSANGDIAARLLIVGAIRETSVQARLVRETVAANGLDGASLRAVWRDTYGNRENNACASELRYVYTFEESAAVDGSIGMWNWLHPSEERAFQSIIDMTSGADIFAQVYLEQLGNYPAIAEGQLQNALGSSGMEAY